MMMFADALEAAGPDARRLRRERSTTANCSTAYSEPAVSRRAERWRVLRAIDKFDRLGSEGVALLLGEGRKDESGDFTKGAGLNAYPATNRTCAFVSASRALCARIGRNANARPSRLLKQVRSGTKG